MHLTALARSRLEAMCTTWGNKLMRGDLSGVGSDGGQILFCCSWLPLVTIVCCFISQRCLSRSLKIGHPSLDALYGFNPQKTTRSHWHLAPPLWGKAMASCFISTSKLAIMVGMVHIVFFPKLLFSNVSHCLLATIKTGSLWWTVLMNAPHWTADFSKQGNGQQVQKLEERELVRGTLPSEVLCTCCLIRTADGSLQGEWTQEQKEIKWAASLASPV